MTSEGTKRKADGGDQMSKHTVLRPPLSALRPRSYAFTLIELLVVIAIIAILAALILSATSKAKNSGSKATDINNLRQIMIAMHTYTSDNGDILPMANWDAGNATGDGKPHRGWLYLPDLDAYGTNRFKADTGALWEFLRNPKIYYCPMDKPTEARYSKHDDTVEERDQQLSSYAMNGAINGFMYYWNHPELPYTKLGAMKPTDCTFWETDEREPFFFNDGANNPPEGVSPRHYQGAIQAACDASVSYIRLETWNAEAAETNKNRLWCFPGSRDGRDPEER